jgi:hypothetical protein
MSAAIDGLIERARGRIGTPALTALANENPQEKPFLLETLAAGAVVVLLQRYCGAYLDGLGLDELGKRHGRASRDLLAKLRGGKSKVATDEDKSSLAEGIEEIRRAPVDEAASGEAEEAVREALVDSGVGAARAKAIAADITGLVVPALDG